MVRLAGFNGVVKTKPIWTEAHIDEPNQIEYTKWTTNYVALLLRA